MIESIRFILRFLSKEYFIRLEYITNIVSNYARVAPFVKYRIMIRLACIRFEIFPLREIYPSSDRQYL